MELNIISIDKVEYYDNVFSIKAPGMNGYFQILNQHIFFISILKNGMLTFTLSNSKKIRKMNIKNGFLQVNKNVVIVLL